MPDRAPLTARSGKITVEVEIDFLSAPEHTLEAAAQKMSDSVRGYLTDDDGPFLNDFGADENDAREFFADPDRTSSDSPVWGGYDGPLVTGVTVRPGRLLDQGSATSDVPADQLEHIEQWFLNDIISDEDAGRGFVADPDHTSSDSPAGSATSDVPADLLEYIEQVLQTQDYALYVLDGQRADLDPDDQDDWHDAVAIVEINRGLRMVKFTRAPDGAMNHYDPTERRSL